MKQNNNAANNHQANGGTGRRTSPKNEKHGWKIAGRILGTVALVGVTTLIIFMCIFMTYVKTSIIPYTDVDVSGINMKMSSQIVCQNPDTGEWEELQTLYAEENRIPVSFEELPDYVWKALVAIEDRRFFDHHGVDWLSTGKAVFTMFFGSSNRGGSTLTQQLIKNVTGENQVTVKRKVTEIFRALAFEKKYTKEDIIEMYLNQVYFGQQCYGIGAAAKTYFGKTVQELTVAEAAAIIGITNSPSANDPLRSAKCRQRCLDRKDLILKEMWDQGAYFNSEEEYEAAKNQTLVFVGDDAYQGGEGQEEKDTGKVFSYFVDQVIRDVVEELQVQKDISESTARSLLYNAGYTIYCTMNPKAQEVVDSVYTNLENLPYTSTKGQQLQSAITIIDPNTGNIIAMAGGVGEKDKSLTTNRAFSARPCGSAIKPLSVYSLALEKGALTPASVIDDYPLEYDAKKERAWPKNAYSGYKGLVTLQYALQQSSNTCAVRTLELVGINDSFQWMTENLGFTTLVAADKDRGPLGLGGLTRGVNTAEMAAAYATFANNGIYNTPRTFTKVVDKNEQVVLENNTESWAAMKEETVYMMNDLLKQVVSSGTGTSANFSGMTIAGKTGTTSNNYDRYFVGYTPYYCAAVWIGYDYMENIRASGNPAAVLWKKVMSQLHEGLPNKAFAGSDDGLVSVTVCTKSGMLASSLCTACGETHTVLVPKDSAPEEECTIHVSREVCVTTDAQGNVQRHLAAPDCYILGHVTTEILLDYPRGLVQQGETYVQAADSDRLLLNYPHYGYHSGGRIDPDEPVSPDEPTDPETPSQGGIMNFWNSIFGN